MRVEINFLGSAVDAKTSIVGLEKALKTLDAVASAVARSLADVEVPSSNAVQSAAVLKAMQHELKATERDARSLNRALAETQLAKTLGLNAPRVTQGAWGLGPSQRIFAAGPGTGASYGHVRGMTASWAELAATIAKANVWAERARRSQMDQNNLLLNAARARRAAQSAMGFPTAVDGQMWRPWRQAFGSTPGQSAAVRAIFPFGAEEEGRRTGTRFWGSFFRAAGGGGRGGGGGGGGRRGAPSFFEGGYRGALFGESLGAIIPGGSRARGPALAAAVGLAGAAVAPIAPAVTALLASIPALAAAGAGAIATLALAFGGLGKAIGGDKKEYDKLNPAAQKFVLNLRQMIPFFQHLKKVVQSELLPTLTGAFEKALSPTTVGLLEQGLGRMAKALGTAATHWGKFLGSSQFANTMGPLLQAGSGWMVKLSDATMEFASAMLTLGHAAIPFTTWMTDGIEKGSRLLDTWLRGAEASGQLSRGIDAGKESIRLLGGLVVALSKALFQLGVVLAPMGTLLLTGLTSALEQFAGWIEKNREALQSLTTGALKAFFTLIQGAGQVLDPMFQGLDAIVNALGNWEQAFRLLFSLGIVLQLKRIATAFWGVSKAEAAAMGTAAAGSGKYGSGLVGLLGGLKGLAAIGIITITIDIIMSKSGQAILSQVMDLVKNPNSKDATRDRLDSLGQYVSTYPSGKNTGSQEVTARAKAQGIRRQGELDEFAQGLLTNIRNSGITEKQVRQALKFQQFSAADIDYIIKYLKRHGAWKGWDSGAGSGPTTGTGRVFPTGTGPHKVISGPGVAPSRGGKPGASTHNQEDWQSRNAIDIAARPHTKVLAVESGRITKVSGRDPSEGIDTTTTGKKLFGYGVTLVGARNTYYYAHLDDVTVKAGQHVLQGTVIGYSSSLGHVHFAVQQGNPASFTGGTVGPGNAQTPQQSSGTPTKGKPPPWKPGKKGPSPGAGLGLVIAPNKLTKEQERVAELIYNTAIARGASPQVALAMVVGAYLESRLDPKQLGGGLFQISQSGNPKVWARYLALVRQGIDPATAAVIAMLPAYVTAGKAHAGEGPVSIAQAAERPAHPYAQTQPGAVHTAQSIFKLSGGSAAPAGPGPASRASISAAIHAIQADLKKLITLRALLAKLATHDISKTIEGITITATVGAPLSERDAALKKRIDQWEKQLKADRDFIRKHKHLTAQQLAVIRERDRHLVALINEGTARLKASVNKRKQDFLDKWQELTQAALDAFDKATERMVEEFDRATAKMKTPAEILIEQLTSAHEQQALQDAVDEARKHLQAALAGLDEETAAETTRRVTDVVAKYSVAHAVDVAQAALLGIKPTDMTSDLLKELHEALQPHVSQQAIVNAQKELEEALFNQKMYYLEKQAAAEREALDERRAKEREEMLEQREQQRKQFEILLAMWGAYWASVGATAAQAYEIFDAIWFQLTGTHLPKPEKPTLPTQPPHGGSGIGVKPLAAGGIVKLAGGAILRTPTFLAGEAGDEAVIPLSDPRAKNMLGGDTLVEVSFANGMEWLEQFVDVRVIRNSERIYQKQGRRSDTRRRGGTM